MGNEIQVTATEEAGAVQDDAAQAAAAQATQDGTATGIEAGEQTEEQKQAQAAEAEAARKAAEINPDEEFKKLSPKAQEHINKKIKKLSGETKAEREARHAAELKAARLEGENEALKRQGTRADGASQPKAEDIAAQFVKANPKPRAEDFETAADHAEAVADWTYRKNDAIKSGLAEAKETETKQTTAKTEQDRAQQEYDEKLDAQRARGEEKYEDFEEVISAVKYHPATLAAMTASEAGEDIAYYLANNPAEIARISKLTPFLQAKEVGRIELGLETGKLQIKKTTAAPPPARTVAGNAPAKIDASKLSDPDWYKQKKQQKINSA